MGLGIPPLKIRIKLESNALKSRILVQRLAVRLASCDQGDHLLQASRDQQLYLIGTAVLTMIIIMIIIIIIMIIIMIIIKRLIIITTINVIIIIIIITITIILLIIMMIIIIIVLI